MNRLMIAGLAALVAASCQDRQNGTEKTSEAAAPAAEISQPQDAPITLDQLAAALNPTLKGGQAPQIAATVPETGRVYFTPTPAGTVRVVRNGRQTDVHWNTLSQDEVRGLLENVDEQVTIEQIDTRGGVTALPVSARLERGTYRVTYYTYKYTNIPCRENAPDQGGIAVGVGLKVTATVLTNKAGVDLTDLVPLAIAYSRNEVRGSLRVQAFGIATGNSSIGSYLSATSGLSPESIKKAVESFGVVKAVVETEGVTLRPNWLFMETPDKPGCLASLTPTTAS